jgi:hypothetical protein
MAAQLYSTHPLRHAWIANVVVTLVALAIAARAVLAPGWMLMPADDGRFLTVVMCQDHGVQPRVLDLETGEWLDAGIPPSGNPDGAPGDTPLCPGATATALSAAPTPGDQAAAPSGLAVPVANARPADLVPGRGLAAPPPRATGPPVTFRI